MIAESVFRVLTPFETQAYLFGSPFSISEKDHLFEIIVLCSLQTAYPVKDKNIEFQKW